MGVGGAAIAMAGAILLLLPTGAGAQGEPTVRPVAARASAEGVRVSLAAPGYLLVDVPVDTGGPVVQSVYEPFGERTAYAAAPFPGELVTNLPGLLQAFGGPALPVTYPLIASATDPSTPSQDVEDPSGTYTLHAEAAAAGAASSAKVAPNPPSPGSGMHATSKSTLEKDGAVRAKASTSVDGLVIAGILDMGVVRSTVEAALPADATTPTVQRSLDISGASVGGISVRFGEQGIEVAGTQVPGTGASAATDAVNAALKAAQLEVRVVRGTDVPGGGNGDVVEIVSKRTLPLPGNPEGTITVRIGGASAAILTGDQAPAPPATGSAGPVPSDGPRPVGPGSGNIALDSPVTPGASVAPGPGSVPAGDASTPAVFPRRRASVLRPFEFDDGFRIFYLALVLGGCALVLAAWKSKEGTVRRAGWI